MLGPGATPISPQRVGPRAQMEKRVRERPSSPLTRDVIVNQGKSSPLEGDGTVITTSTLLTTSMENCFCFRQGMGGGKPSPFTNLYLK